MKGNFSLLLFTFIFFTGGTFSFAGGFQINTQGQKALGMGGAFTGLCSDASTVYFNPGGIASLEGKSKLTTGVSLIFPNVSVQTLAEWAKTAEDRGFTIVPVSALMAKPQ